MQISDSRLAAYVTAAAALPAATLETITRLCEAKAQHSDDGAHAVVGAVLAVAAGTPITAAVRQNLRRAEVDRIRQWQQTSKSETALESLSFGALEAATATRDDDRTGDDETADRRETFATALGALGNGDRAILAAVTGDAMVRYGTKVDTTRDDAGVAGKSGRLPLRVSVVGAAVGIPAKGNGEALRAAACLSWARLSVTLRPPTGDVLEAVQARAEHSVRYVTRDTRAWMGRGQAVWQQEARPTGIPAATYSRTPVYPTDPAMRGAASSLPGVMPGTEGAVIRGAVVVPTYTPGTVWGAGPAVPLVVTDHLSAKGAKAKTRRMEADDRAAVAYDDRVSERPCQRPREDSTCGCGARPAGTALEVRGWVREVSPYSTAVRNGSARAKGGDRWVVETPEHFHPAMPCSAPREGRGGVMRCGCGRKRGALVNGCHR